MPIVDTRQVELDELYDPKARPRRKLGWIFLLVFVGLSIWSVVLLGGWMVWSHLSAEWNDYKAMKGIIVYNLQQGRIVLPQQMPAAPPPPVPAPVPAPLKPEAVPKK